MGSGVIGRIGRIGPICALAAALLFSAPASPAQEAPPPPKPYVKLQFLPPPMEGTISLGIYDAAGKLVRTLHKEAAVDSDAFFKEINGLVTFWDGKDDAGNLLPAGTYSARGFTVGDLQIEGEAFHCNDWASDDNSPHIRRITDIGPFSDTIALNVVLADGKPAIAHCAASGTVSLNSEGASDQKDGYIVRDGKIFAPGSTPKQLELPSLGTPVAAAAGRDNSVWVIDRAADGSTEVKQYSLKGEFLRRLAIDPTQPIPTKIAASSTTDAIALLEESPRCQRFRWLELSRAESAPGQPISTWKEVLRRDIAFSDTFAQIQSELKMPGGKPFDGKPTLRVPLMANPLLQDKVTALEVSLGTDAQGSFLKTADGLLLKRITDTPLLKWALMDREADTKLIVVFQGDGAAVEEFRIGNIGNIMAFDYGAFAFDPAK